MAFDPSIISEIPKLSPDPVAAESRAYQLSDLIDRNQINKMTLASEKQKSQDLSKVKEVLSKSDLSTFEGQQKAASEVSKINPQMGMDLLREFQGSQKGKGELDLQQYQLLSAHNDIIAQRVQPIKDMSDQLSAKGIPEAQINAMIAPRVIQTFQQLSQMKLPNGQPVIGDQEKQYFQQIMQNGNLKESINELFMHSQKARDILKTKLAERKQDETERHNQKMEEIGNKRTEIQSTRESGSQFTEKMGNLMAALAARGVSLPAGLRSRQQQVSLYKGLLDRYPDKTVDEIAEEVARGTIEFGAQKKETQTAANVAGKVEVAQNEIEEFIPLVRDASSKVPRDKFVPVNKLLQMKQSSMSDPNLKALRIRINSVLNAYDMLASRGGTDAEKRAEVRNLITSADSPEALESALSSFELEAAAAHRAAVKATKVPELKDDYSRKTSGGVPPPPPGFVVQ